MFPIRNAKGLVIGFGARTMNGDEQPRFSSGRTLFGIRSAAEEKMDRFAREIEEEQRQKRLERERGERGEGRES